MATQTHKTEEVAPAAPVAVAAPVAPKVIAKGPRSHLVMMLLAVLLTPTGLARAYRGEQIGWTRFWVFVGTYAASLLLFWIPLINTLFLLALIGLYVWGAVDVFQLRKTKTDAQGHALVTSEVDEKFANAFYVFFIVCLILSGVGLLLGIIFGTILVGFILNSANNRTSLPNSRDFDSSEYLRQFDTYSR